MYVNSYLRIFFKMRIYEFCDNLLICLEILTPSVKRVEHDTFFFILQMCLFTVFSSLHKCSAILDTGHSYNIIIARISASRLVIFNSTLEHNNKQRSLNLAQSCLNSVINIAFLNILHTTTIITYHSTS
jgi:hypothetical protein